MSNRDPKTRQRAKARRHFMLVAGVGAVGALTDRQLPARASSKAMPKPVVNVRRLGAKGNGQTNDTAAFQRAAGIINEAGCGTILIPPGTYIVGQQTLTGARGQDRSYRAEPIIRIQDCPGPVLIKGLDSGPAVYRLRLSRGRLRRNDRVARQCIGSDSPSGS